MSIERILSNPELVESIAARLAAPGSEALYGTQLSPERVLAASAAAQAGRESSLLREEEAIVRRMGRPVFLVRSGRIEGNFGAFWASRISAARASLERMIPAVGRIELERHPTRDWAGTGWLIAPGVLVTNRHVALTFGQSRGEEFILWTDPLGNSVLPSIDFDREQGSRTRHRFRIGRALHVEPLGVGRPDVAFFQVEERSSDDQRALSDFVPLCEMDPVVGSVVGVIGYPARDSMRNDAAVMEEIFAGVYDVKRFHPGEISEQKSSYLCHDCSTLGGNSGSLLLDFASGFAAGLHYAGYYEKTNYAVKASTLAELLHKLRIDVPKPARAVPVAERSSSISNPEPRRVQRATASALEPLLQVALESPSELPSSSLTPEQTRELIQLLGEAREAMLTEESDVSDLGSSPEHEVAARLQSWLRQNAELRAQVEQLDGEIKYDNRDLRWGLSLLNWLRGLKKHAQSRPGEDVEVLPNKASIAIVGDWGSGLYAAPLVAASIARGAHDLGVHLGDVYYAGTESEVRDNFLKFWPRHSPRMSRTLNANHEMYSGGYGYFKLALPALGQQGSYFAAQNDHYLIVGLDTAYTDFDLDDEQVRWLLRRIEAAGQRRLILMSHHQLYSHNEPASDKLVRRLEQLLTGRKVFVWYWGHEHAAIVFEQHPKWGLHARCVGHGGFPYFRHRGDEAVQQGLEGSRWRALPATLGAPAALLLDDPNPYVAPEADPERYGAQGYMSVWLDGPRFTERLHRPDGTVIYQRVLAE